MWHKQLSAAASLSRQSKYPFQSFPHLHPNGQGPHKMFLQGCPSIQARMEERPQLFASTLSKLLCEQPASHEHPHCSSAAKLLLVTCSNGIMPPKAGLYHCCFRQAMVMSALDPMAITSSPVASCRKLLAVPICHTVKLVRHQAANYRQP